MENCHYLLLSLIIIFTCSPFTVPIKKIDLAVRDKRTTNFEVAVGQDRSFILSTAHLKLIDSPELRSTATLRIRLIDRPTGK